MQIPRIKARSGHSGGMEPVGDGNGVLLLPPSYSPSASMPAKWSRLAMIGAAIVAILSILLITLAVFWALKSGQSADAVGVDPSTDAPDGTHHGDRISVVDNQGIIHQGRIVDHADVHNSVYGLESGGRSGRVKRKVVVYGDGDIEAIERFFNGSGKEEEWEEGMAMIVSNETFANSTIITDIEEALLGLAPSIRPVLKQKYDPPVDATFIYHEGKARIFFGIPYTAHPITAETAFDFAHHIGNGSWQENDDFGPICPQLVKQRDSSFQYNGSIDCLTVNVFSPLDTSRLHPVLLFLHGGSLLRGSASELGYHGIVEQLVHRHNIVVVTAQYRLGVWGWYRRDEHSHRPGVSARGAWDALNALYWTNRNINRFGGDPRRVTLAGHESGACIASWISMLALHNTRPKFNGAPVVSLFNNVVLQSGSSIYCMIGGISKKNPSDALRKHICPEQSDAACLEKIGRMEPEILVNETFNALVMPLMQLEPPDARFRSFTSMRDRMLPAGHAPKRLNFMMGIVRDEWAYFDGNMSPWAREKLGGTIDESFVKKLMYVAKGIWNDDDMGISVGLSYLFDSTVEDALKYYPGWDTDHKSQTWWYRACVRLQTDGIFTAPMFEDAHHFATRGHNVYFYRFSHSVPPQLHRYGHAEYIKSSFGDAVLNDVVPHMSDVNYLFLPEEKWLEMAQSLPRDEVQRHLDMANRVADVWAQFIYNGSTVVDEPEWGKMDLSKQWHATKFLELRDGKAEKMEPPDSADASDWSWEKRLAAHHDLMIFMRDWRLDNVHYEK